MRKIGIFCFIYWLGGHASFGQEAQVIELAPVEIIPTDKILVYSNFSKKDREKMEPYEVLQEEKKLLCCLGLKILKNLPLN